MKLKEKIRWQKRYIAFFTIVPILAATAIFQVSCPVCEGTGQISSTGMGDVHIMSEEHQELTVFLAGCDAYRVYSYNIDLVLENRGDDEAAGYITASMIDYTEGKLMDSSYIVAVVPPHSTVEFSFVTHFVTSVMIDIPDITEIRVQVLDGNVDCLACKGSGTIPFNTLPLINELKNSFIETQRAERPYMPPLVVDSEGTEGIDY